jgi:hypothetical protein
VAGVLGYAPCEGKRARQWFDANAAAECFDTKYGGSFHGCLFRPGPAADLASRSSNGSARCSIIQHCGACHSHAREHRRANIRAGYSHAGSDHYIQP